MEKVMYDRKEKRMNLNNVLYGDGVHDDYPAIQEMIDSGKCEVVLPVPQKEYLISKTLLLPSHFRLVLPRFARIKLADGANCCMVSNKMVYAPAERSKKDWEGIHRQLWYYVNEYSPEAVVNNIEICGGIWDFNNQKQLPNPERMYFDVNERQVKGQPYGYTGEGMLFYGVSHLKLSSMTLKDPVHWGASFDRVSYFTVEDITFDYNQGNPCAINMDGIHLNGNCHFGVIRNLKGACYDDLVAVNAHEGSRGPITNIEINGLFAENCHSAVRLLTVSDNVEKIHISNVYGTYYQYCIGLTKFYHGETTGVFDAISIDHIYASKAFRDGIYPWPNSYIYPFFYLQEDIRAGHITISDVYRKEYCVPVETIYIGKHTEVESLILEKIVTENHTEKEMPFMVNHGKVKNLHMSCLSEQ